VNAITDKVKQGKRNRASGRAFELKVRHWLESKGWIVAKWSNNLIIDEEKEKIILEDINNSLEGMPLEKLESFNKNKIKPREFKLIPCKPKFNPFTKGLMMNAAGFPDFIIYKFSKSVLAEHHVERYVVYGVEVKSNGSLSKEEKEKCQWLLDNRIFHKILIASKGDKRGEIQYNEFRNL